MNTNSSPIPSSLASPASITSGLSAGFQTPESQPSQSSSGPDRLEEISVVIPAMNEEASLAELHERITDVCAEQNVRVQIVFVDDGSTDRTWEKMVELCGAAADHSHSTCALRLRRNFGKAAALSAGFSVARGAIVFTMDADLQDDPTEIPRFLEKIQGGLDVVSGWKQTRHDPWHKVLPSRVFNALVSSLTGVQLHDHNCGFKAYRREVLAEVDLYGERHRFIPVLASARGFRVGEIVVQHHARQHGVSKYGVSRLVKGFLDLLSIHLVTGYGRRPLHLIGTAGLLCFAVGSVGMIYLSIKRILSELGYAEPLHLHSTAVFYYCIFAVLLGAQCVLAGLLAELVISVAAARDRHETMHMHGESMPSTSNTAGGSRLLPNASGYSLSDWAGLGEPDDRANSAQDTNLTGPIHDA
ncbi:Glycosyltransferase [Rhodopirellula islandica]|uniref:Glycosyltransferase n=1 Tax=Rhodopirellula islandica TaxID=595434 RepID=A0A0J1BGV3_RHOIS|nr:glycosyltransferase family 2 protein [Rhodopirellula islandica]KLU05783.1 Glycosyltransferase [Rhodopirellula islandica]